MGILNENRIDRVMGLFEKNWNREYDPDEDPAFILAGNVPDYSHRLPEEYRVCVPLGSHGGVRFVYYNPRAFEVGDGVLTLHDGHLGYGTSGGEAEFSVSVGSENIVDSLFLHRVDYTGPELHEI